MSFSLKNSLMTARNTAAAAGAGALMLVGQAHAAVPAEVTTALTEAKEDGLVVAGAVLVVIISIAAFKFIRRAI